MKIVEDLAELPAEVSGPVVTVGAYDGVHRGHQQILKRIIQRARDNDAVSALLTFSPHPQKVVSGANAPLLLQTPSQKKELLARIGIDYLVEIPFTRKLSLLDPSEFVEKMLMKRGIHEVHVGWNFRFGHKRSGDLDTLRELGAQHNFKVFGVSAFSFRGVRISSTKVRSLLSRGNVSLAGRYLGRPYQIEGRVVQGDRRGRQLGFPTANLESANELLPGTGVYAGYLHSGETTWPCVTNVGYRPTVDSPKTPGLIVESHLIDFEGNLYGSKASLDFCFKLRDERTFDGLGSLKEQIERDVARARRYLSSIDSRIPDSKENPCRSMSKE